LNFRHITELRPRLVKLRHRPDSLDRAPPARQALVAGIIYVAA